MKLGEKMMKLRSLEGHARGLGRDLTQNEVVLGVRELGGRLSQPYLSQIEKGSRPHLTAGTRLVLARFFRVHPGYLVDDVDDMHHLTHKPRRALDDRLDSWLIDGAEEFRGDAQLNKALLAIAKHEQSRECLILLGSLVENRALIDRLVEKSAPPPGARKRRRA